MAVTSFTGGGGSSDQGGTLLFAAELLSAGCKKDQTLTAGVYLLNIYGTGTLTVKTYAGSANEFTSTVDIVVSGEKSQLITLAADAKGLFFSGMSGYIAVRDWAALPSATAGIVAPATTFFPTSGLTLFNIPSGGGSYVYACGEFLFTSVSGTTWYTKDGVTWGSLSSTGLGGVSASNKVFTPTVFKGNLYAGFYTYGTYNTYYTRNISHSVWNGTSFSAAASHWSISPFTTNQDQYYGKMAVHNDYIYGYGTAIQSIGSIQYVGFNSAGVQVNGAISGGNSSYGVTSGQGLKDFAFMSGWAGGTSNYFWGFAKSSNGPGSRETVTDPANHLVGQKALIKNGTNWIRMQASSWASGAPYWTWGSLTQTSWTAGMPDLTGTPNGTFPNFGVSASVGDVVASADEASVTAFVRLGASAPYSYITWTTSDGLTWTSLATGQPYTSVTGPLDVSQKYVLSVPDTAQFYLTSKNSGTLGVI
jgi:hypothetical protein